MKALVYTGPKQLAYMDAPNPEAGDRSLIEVEHCGICGSDMHAWAGHDDRRPAPLILGHEVAGRIISGPMTGKRVTVNPLVGCGECAACTAGMDNLCAKRQIISMPPREGGFAELLAMRPENLVEIPEGVASSAAALAEPIACGWHGVRLAEAILGPLTANSRALVQGGGAIGLGAALVLKARGVQEIHVAEPHAERREMIEAQGLHAFDPTAQAAPEGVDLVVDGVGIPPTRAAASAAARPGGVIVHIGLGGSNEGLDIRRLTLQEIAFLGSYTYTPQDFRDTASAIFDGSLGALDWPDVRSLSDGAAAFEEIAAGQAAAPKIILTP